VYIIINTSDKELYKLFYFLNLKKNRKNAKKAKNIGVMNPRNPRNPKNPILLSCFIIDNLFLLYLNA